jgi:hypothetical protein
MVLTNDILVWSTLVSKGPLYFLLRRSTAGDLRASIFQRGDQRVGQHDFKVEYETVSELMECVRKLTQITSVLEQRLLRLISLDSVSRLGHDVHNSIFRGIEQQSGIHVQVLKNLVSKLPAKSNHTYSEVIRMLSRLYKRRLGGAHYKELAFLFGLQGDTSMR